MVRDGLASTIPLHPTRALPAAIGAAALALLLACGSDGGSAGGVTRYPTPGPGDTYFTLRDYSPPAQTPEQLAMWMETEHLDYSLDGWFFFGSLVDDQRPDDATAFWIVFQRLGFMRTPTGGQVGPLAVGFNQKSVNRYEYAALFEDVPSTQVVVRPDPWTVELYMQGVDAPVATMQAVSGRMGAVGTEYLLQVDLPYAPDLFPDLTGRLQAQVLLRDRLGAISQGYGATAFCPQYLTAAQRQLITAQHGGSVRSYLESTGDPMIDQGSFYYQLPFLDVEAFSVSVGGQLRSSGHGGLLWLDQIVQTYDDQAYWAIMKNVDYEFFAIQFPDDDVALMVAHVNGGSGDLPAARLFTRYGKRARNSALLPLYSWPIQGIRIEPDPASTFVGAVSQKTYHTRYRLRLDAPEHSADLTIGMAIQNQEVHEQGRQWDYEGLGIVEGTLDGHPVKGQAFLEVVPLPVQ